MIFKTSEGLRVLEGGNQRHHTLPDFILGKERNDLEGTVK
jgi:hypothetical protein